MSDIPQIGLRWSKAIEVAICERIAQGESLNELCLEEGMPAYVTVWRHLRDDEAFREEYDAARVAQADFLADRMLILARKAEDGDAQKANSYRVAADILKWQAMVRAPRKYSERTIHENNTNVPADPQKIKDEIARLQKELGVKTA